MSLITTLAVMLLVGPTSTTYEAPPNVCEFEEECAAPIVDVSQGEGGYVPGAHQSLQLEQRAEEAVKDADGATDVGIATHPSASGGDSSGVGAVAYVPRSGDFEPVGVCMVSDAGPEVARLPRCADLISEEGDDTEQGEPDGEESDESPEPIVITVTRSDFAELPLERPGVHLQPDRDWFLVNMDTLVYTDGGSQMLETTVLDVPVAVRATPVEYSWDFGDGSEPLVTAEPGAPWPAEDIGHVYTSEASDVVITLTTTWSGEFQVAGQGPWIPIAGTTTTHSQSSPFRIDAVETHLTAEG